MQQSKEQSLIDFITGKEIPNTGAEANRQSLERFLIEEKGFLKKDIEVSVPFILNFEKESYRSRVDLIVSLRGKRLIAIKCAAGSLGSREREILAAARLVDTYQIPFAMVSDGKTAILLDTISGKKIGQGLGQIPTRQSLSASMDEITFPPFPSKRRAREQLIFRSYDSMNVNRT
jgi:hypothetical protein